MNALHVPPFRLPSLWMTFLVAGLSASCPCLRTPFVPMEGDPYQAALHLNPTMSLGAVNPLIFGNNTQWTDGGDRLLEDESIQWRTLFVERAREVGVTVLRYPGGTLSDQFHWRDGMGTLEERKEGKTLLGTSEKVRLGPVEFLDLCRILGAAPLITVNTVTGSPEEAADWLRLTNVTGLQNSQGITLPRVPFWEIGNEPYLTHDLDESLDLEPEEFGARVTRFIRALRAVDPSIQVGVPFRAEKLGTQTYPRIPNFIERMLTKIEEPFDFIAVHDAYFPVASTNALFCRHSADLYEAAMAATSVVEEDLAFHRSLLQSRFPGRTIPMALTEHNALFTVFQGPTDLDGLTLTAALYEADLFRLLLEQPDILMSNFWSLTGNGFFGTLARNGARRPSHTLLARLSQSLRGERVFSELETPTMATVGAGAVPARGAVPNLAAVAVRDGNVVHALLINRHPRLPVQLTVDIRGAAAAQATAMQLWTRDPFHVDDQASWLDWADLPVQVSERQVLLSLHAHAAALLDITLP